MNNDDDRLATARAFLDRIPHSRELNIRIDSLEAGKAELSMPYDPKLIGDPETGVVHGGAVSALLDTCAGAAAFSHPSALSGTSTLTLNIHYMRPASPGCRIFGTAECYHTTRFVAFVRAIASDGHSDIPVATASGAFTVG